MASHPPQQRSPWLVIPEILQAGRLSGLQDNLDRWVLSPDRAWLLAPLEGQIDLVRPGVHHSLTVDDIVLLGPGSDWRLEIPVGARFLHVAFQLHAVDGRPTVATPAGGLRCGTIDCPLVIPAALLAECRSLMQLIHNDYWRHGGAHLRATGRLALLLGSLACHQIEDIDRDGLAIPTSDTSPLVRQALVMLHEYRYAIDLKELAALLSVSAGHLGRLFRQDMGISLRSYRDERRRGQVLQLLTGTELPIQAIASISGHRHPSSLGRAVQRWFGCSPSELRQRALCSRTMPSEPELRYSRALVDWRPSSRGVPMPRSMPPGNER